MASGFRSTLGAVEPWVRSTIEERKEIIDNLVHAVLQTHCNDLHIGLGSCWAEVSRLAAFVKSAFELREVRISSHQPEPVMVLPLLSTSYRVFLLL